MCAVHAAKRLGILLTSALVIPISKLGTRQSKNSLAYSK